MPKSGSRHQSKKQWHQQQTPDRCKAFQELVRHTAEQQLATNKQQCTMKLHLLIIIKDAPTSRTAASGQ